MDELSLVEIIRILVKGKKIISLVTAVCLLVTVIIVFFMMDPIYESQTMLMISPITNAVVKEDDNNFSGLVSTLSQYPQMTIDTYREQVKAPVILQYLRKELDMEDVPLSAIANKITVRAIDKTNLITIGVRDTNPDQAAKIANLVSNKFTEFVSSTNKKQAENSAKFIQEQMEKEKINMEDSSKKLEEFLAKPRGPQELRLELDGKLSKITEFKTTVAQVKVDVQAAKSSLSHAKNLLNSTPKTMVTSKTLVNNDLLSDLIKEKTGLSTLDISKLKLTDEEINEVYVALSASVNELELEVSSLTAQGESLEKEITVLQKEIEMLQSELASKQQEYDLLQHELDLNRQTYDAYQAKYKEAMIKESAEIGKSSILIVSEAIAPKSPVAPRKILISGISALVGFLLGFGFVFINDYMGKNKEISSIKV
ncbi:MAG: lipopolysaccharide biosynthesis protein [Clostridiaceae bacterium]|nr:lipopolysaccharide biosynthesis protein [Clostridiaceae bacterium]